MYFDDIYPLNYIFRLYLQCIILLCDNAKIVEEQVMCTPAHEYSYN